MSEQLSHSSITHLSPDKHAQYILEEVFPVWVNLNWAWLAVDGGGGVGKTEIQKWYEKYGVGLSAGDYFRAANKVLSDLGMDESPHSLEAIHWEIPTLSVITRVLNGNKKIVVHRRGKLLGEFDPDGSGKDGLRNPDLRVSFTNALSRDPEVVAWWKQQVRETLSYSRIDANPAITVGRTHRNIRQDEKERADWAEHLKSSAFAYIYASREVLAERSAARAEREYASGKVKEGITRQEYIEYSIKRDWERTVGEMERPEEQLVRPEQAHKLAEASIYDFVLNTSKLKIAEVQAIMATVVMYTLAKEQPYSSIYYSMLFMLLGKLRVPNVDPDLQRIEDDIEETIASLQNNHQLEAA